MRKIQFLIGFILLLSVFFVFFELKDDHENSAYIKALVVPAVCLTYFYGHTYRIRYFTLFLTLFSIAEILAFIGGFLPVNFEYYLGNILFITAYTVLILGIMFRLNYKLLIRKFRLTILVLFGLNVYVGYVLFSLVNLKLPAFSMLLEFTYNGVLFLLLTVSFLNYLYRDTKKSLLLFVGSFCIVFSEIIQYAFFYIAEEKMLNIIGYSLLVVGFLFFYSFAIQESSQRIRAVKLL